jgi:hypothetical protein
MEAVNTGDEQEKRDQSCNTHTALGGLASTGLDLFQHALVEIA